MHMIAIGRLLNFCQEEEQGLGYYLVPSASGSRKLLFIWNIS